MRLIRDRITEIQVTSEADLGSCCSSASRLADELGFSSGEADDIAALAADLVGHMVSHHGSEARFFVCRVMDSDSRQGLEIWSCDNGDGISDMLEDVEAWSDAESLPEYEPSALQRLSDEYEINPSWWPDFITIPHAAETGAWIRICSRKWLGTNS